VPSRRIIPLWAFIALGACNVDPTVGPPEKVNGQKAPQVVLDHRGLGVPVDTLVSTVLSASDSFGVLTSVAVKGEYLVVGEAYEAPYLHILDRESGALLTSAVLQGGGPGEFTAAPLMAPTAYRDDLTLSLLSQLTDTESRIDVEAIVEKRPDWLRRSVPMQDSRFSWAGTWLTPDELLVRGYSSRGEDPLLIFDSTGIVQDSLMELPFADERIRPEGLASAYRFHLCAHPDGMQVALPFANTGRLSIVNRRDDSIMEAAVPYRFRPHLPLLGKIMKEFKSGTAGNRSAYFDCVATDSLIYATFSGTLNGKQRNAPPPANTFVHVFDWSGKLLRVHHLDHVAYGIDLDRENSVLYSVSSFPDSIGPSVRRTVLPR
jgi:hypothetical protein